MRQSSILFAYTKSLYSFKAEGLFFFIPLLSPRLRVNQTLRPSPDTGFHKVRGFPPPQLAPMPHSR